MKKRLFLGAIAVAAGLGALAALTPFHSSAQAVAAPAQNGAAHLATATFAVEGMTCAACPITVRTAMSHVAGVRSVEVDFAAHRAIVVYDPGVATTDAIALASTSAGYPARLAPRAERS